MILLFLDGKIFSNSYMHRIYWKKNASIQCFTPHFVITNLDSKSVFIAAHIEHTPNESFVQMNGKKCIDTDIAIDSNMCVLLN